MTNPIIFTLTMPSDVVERLQALADQKQISLSGVLQDALDSYLENQEEWEEDSDEEILSGLRESLQDLKAGRLIDASDVLEEIRQAQLERSKLFRLELKPAD